MSDPGTYTNKYLENIEFSDIFKNELWDIIETAIFFRKRPYIRFSNEEIAFMDTIYGRTWMWTDFKIVTMHFFLNALLISPIFLFLLIN